MKCTLKVGFEDSIQFVITTLYNHGGIVGGCRAVSWRNNLKAVGSAGAFLAVRLFLMYVYCVTTCLHCTLRVPSF
jgi:hypothetical protein